MPDSPDLAAPAPGRNASRSRTKGWLWPLVGLLVTLGAAAAYRSLDTHAGAPRVRLRYAEPEACVWAYRVQIDERFADPGYGRFFNRAEEHSISWLGIRQVTDPNANRDASAGADTKPRSSAQVRLVSQDAGVKPMRGAKLTPQELVKDWEGNAQVQGPAAPDVACRDRSWDPLEDAMGLAFARLPGHAVAVGESWEGARVSGDGSTCSARDACCNLGACLNAEQVRDREAPCVVGPWREALLELDARADTGGLAVIEGNWEDGRPGGQGARAHRRLRFELQPALGSASGRADGRLLDAQITLSHPFLGLTREIYITRVDRCGGSEPALVDAGLEEAAAGLARIEAAFEYKQPGGKAPGG